MAQSRRDRKLGRWGRETALREAPLDEVAARSVQRITIPAEDMPASQSPVSADAAAVAVVLRELRRRLRWARWIPWRRKTRPRLQAQIDALVQQRHRMRGGGSRSTRL